MRLAFAPHEITAAFYENVRPPRQDQIDAFARQQIGAWAVAGAPGSGEHCIGFARTEKLADGRFEFTAEGGTPSMVAIALDTFNEPADLVAWPLRCDWIASWIGRAVLLGEQHIDGPRLETSLAVYRTPLDWLRAERNGVVLVDRPRAARALQDAGPLLATGGIEHAAQLVALLTAPPPRVNVPSPHKELQAA